MEDHGNCALVDAVSESKKVSQSFPARDKLCEARGMKSLLASVDWIKMLGYKGAKRNRC